MRNLQELRGQKIASRMLDHYSRAPLPPLLILHGPDGTGKWSAAEALIRIKMCEVGTGCGTCPACRKFDKDLHADYIRFPDQRVLIGDAEHPDEYTIRWLLQTRIRYTPFDGNIRFVLIPRAEALQHEAETALLKTLEEPPEHTRFIFLTRHLSDLKETIISRGVTVPFQLLSHAELKSLIPGAPEEWFDFLGGSLHLAPLLQSPLLNKMKEWVDDAFSHPLKMLEMERRVTTAEKSGFGDLLEKGLYGFEEILDLLGLIILRHAAGLSDNGDMVREAVFEFKQELHNNQSGMTPYLLSLFFHRLTSAISR